MKKIFCALTALLSLNVLANFTPYTGEPPAPALTAQQQAEVTAGKLVWLLNNQKGEFKEGSVAFRVNARPEAIWMVLGDFTKYAEWSYKVGSASVYKRVGTDLYIDFMTDTLSKHYYVMNKFGLGWSTWATDHSKTQDCVLDTVGFWRVSAVNGNPNQSDVVQYGKVQLTSLCANGFFGIGGFNANDMANTIYKNLKARAEAL